MNIVLNLTIKRKWFDMIASGEKREEYRCTAQVRNASDSWCSTYSGVMVLRSGYRMDSPAVAVRITGISSRVDEVIHPEWGETSLPHYVIAFDKIIARGTYAEVKEWLKKGGVK